jgi:hypothetical protein
VRAPSLSFVLVLASLASIPEPTRADDWPIAHPRSWYGQGFSRVVEVFPARSRQNPGDKPLAYAYDLGYPGTTWKIDAKLIWKAALPNREAPYEAIVSSDGWLVTLDDWGNLGFDNALVIYDPAGKLIKALKLDGLVPADVADRDRSKSSRYWRRGAQYLFDTKAKLFQIQLDKAGVVEVSLATGAAQYVDAAKASKLANPETATINEISLRFSSITDLLAERARPAAPAPAKRP